MVTFRFKQLFINVALFSLLASETSGFNLLSLVVRDYFLLCDKNVPCVLRKQPEKHSKWWQVILKTDQKKHDFKFPNLFLFFYFSPVTAIFPEMLLCPCRSRRTLWWAGSHLLHEWGDMLQNIHHEYALLCVSWIQNIIFNCMSLQEPFTFM